MCSSYSTIQTPTALVEEHHPDDVDSLKCCDCGDFSHGFNSGVLAGLRWVLTAQTEGFEEADNCFPELDT